MIDKIQNFESILVGKFASQPTWVRVTTYLVMLALYVYLMLTPSFIWGECRIKNADGSFIPYRGGTIHYVVEGRIIKSQINEEGVWSVPVVSKLPGEIEISFLNENKQYPLKFKTSVWSNPEHIVYFNDSTGGFSIAEVQSSSPLHLVAEFFQSVLNRLGPQEAFAQKKLKMKKQPMLLKKKAAPKAVIKDEFAETVHKSIAQYTGMDISKVETTTLLGNPNISQVKRIKLVYGLQKDFGITISDEEWNSIYTVGDVTEMVRQKVNSKK